MTRGLSSRQNAARAKAGRQIAINRSELRQPSQPRETAAGPTSLAVKAVDPATREMIEAFLARRK